MENKLKKKRKELNLSKAYIAQELGINERKYSSWESGRADITLLAAGKLSVLLKLSLNEIYEAVKELKLNENKKCHILD
ncbi:helix-turn-helix transcriptional regulator [Clostridium neonatale]|uniref:helix-turn-helix transcriptional regulator n=1 Tax=Clostridium neonatale TaxID=137838 RepID=UPI00291BE9EB|nr:helix-turn-helix transcriptional regulator [Clostridium neonatale]CAI3207613.1 putative Regulatory protein MunI [Clostridium neonatale]